MLDPERSQDLPARALSKEKQLWLIAIGAGVLVVLFLAIALAHQLLKPALPVPPPVPAGAFRSTPEQLAELRIETVRTGNNPGEVSATGTISLDEERSTPVILPYSGQVRDVLVQAGQRVSRGQPLLKVASSDFADARNALLSAAAQQATAAAQLKIAQDNEKRQAAIFQTAGGALKDYRQSESDLVAAQSTIRSASAASAAARDKLALLGKATPRIGPPQSSAQVGGVPSQTIYRAPIAGTIATRDVAPGQYITAGGDKPVMTISDLTRVWLVAQVDQSDAAKVHLGDTVQVTTPAYPGRSFRAVIDNIGAGLDPTTHRLPVRATIANPDEPLKPQMFASFTIQRATGRSTVLVPALAVIHEGDSARVWVAGRDGLLFARTVTVADSANGMDIIMSGLQPGERVVTSGAIFVNEEGLGE